MKKNKYYLIGFVFFILIVGMLFINKKYTIDNKNNSDISDKKQIEYNIYRSKFSKLLIDDENKFDVFLKSKWDEGIIYNSDVVFVDDDDDYKIVDLFGGWLVDIRE